MQTASDTDPPSLASTIGSIATTIEKLLSPGDVAALRRLAPDDPACAAFWRILALHPDLISGGGTRRDDLERRWACILQAMATMRGLHTPGSPLGWALADAEVAEPRVLRLLRASGPALADAVRITAHHLAQKAVPSNHADLARLVLSDDDGVRRRIARPYYAQLEKESRR